MGVQTHAGNDTSQRLRAGFSWRIAVRSNGRSKLNLQGLERAEGMPRYSEECKASLVARLMPPNARRVVDVRREKGSTAGRGMRFTFSATG